MHRLSATPGGWTPDTDGVIFVDQTPAPLVLLTAADTDVQTLAHAIPGLPDGFPAVRVVNLLHLQQQLSIDTYAEQVLSQARGIVVRLLGGRAYWSYGLEVVKALAHETGAALFVLPGDDRPDPDLISHSTVPLTTVNQLWRYLTEGGIDNMRHALQWVADVSLDTTYSPPPPMIVPRVGRYLWQHQSLKFDAEPESDAGLCHEPLPTTRAKVGILFYRAHYLAGNTAAIDALCAALAERGLDPVPLFISSLRDLDVQEDVLAYVQSQDHAPLRLLLNTTSFSLAKLDAETVNVEFWQQLDVPVLQVILSGGTYEQWQAQWQGLAPRDLAMNVALPEVDGRIISRAVSFKAVQMRNDALEADVVVYKPVGDRIQFVADLAANWVHLAETPVAERRVALILANYPTRDGRLANGVGLDTPASCVALLHALHQAGYSVDDIPATGDELIHRLTQGVTNDPEAQDLRRIHQTLSGEDYQHYFAQLPVAVQAGVRQRWGDAGLEMSVSTSTRMEDALEQGHGMAWPYQNQALDQHPSLTSSKDYSTNPKDYSTSSQDYSTSSQDYSTSSQDSLTSSQDYSTSSQDYSTNLKDSLTSSQDYSTNLKDSLTSSEDSPQSGHALPCPYQNPGLNRQTDRTAGISPIPAFAIPGMQLGNIFIGIQPSRGYDRDPALNYHSPDLEPTHDYLAFYHWLRHDFGAHAFVHVGKHGNLEWLPGKSIALSQDCYPEVALGALPHLYPFIVNDPGEGSQAKRRAQAVIIDHLTPPMTRAELYGPLQQLEHLIDEYYEAQSLDPKRLPIIRDRLWQLATQEHLHLDLGLRDRQAAKSQEHPKTTESAELAAAPPPRFSEFLTLADSYLCELKEAQIRDGLHILGQCPTGRQLRDLIVAIARQPGAGRKGITRAIARDYQLDLDPLMADLAHPIEGRSPLFDTEPSDNPVAARFESCRTHGDVVEQLEQDAATLIDAILEQQRDNAAHHPSAALPPIGEATRHELDWVRSRLLPALRQTDQELSHLLHGLDGRYVPSGASGAPTRGRADVLPTGRNFYSVDIRAIPTESAWSVGRNAAELLIERYTQDHGDYPQTLGLSIWGTSTMRTGGDDLAEALALIGVQPVWDGASRRVIDFEILPLSQLGRPRVDVTLRVSGFFRDAFGHLISLFDQAVEAIARLDEPADQNPLAAHVRRDTQALCASGLSVEQGDRQSRYRVFGSKPGAYGAGLQGLIESQNWMTDDDLALAYLNWSSYAYTGLEEGRAAPRAFEQRLRELQIVLHNQDNREHDLLDSDDYYQFQGGLTAAVRSLQGRNPATYFGDHANPARPRIRQLREEIARVYRSRVVNPKWITGVMRHGYKGAFEMAATVDYLFAYDATTHCVDDHMYQGIAETYVLDPDVQSFVQNKNPWALRDMAERLLEAHQRHLWQTVSPSTLDQLKAIAHAAEAKIEAHTNIPPQHLS
jgi:cobaltochelatase CobN